MEGLALPGGGAGGRVKPIKRRADEEYARRCFARFLEGRTGGRGSTWRVGEDPPDFRLLVGDSEFVVEVTSVVERIPCGGGEITDPLVEAVQLAFVETVRQLAGARSVQTGLFLLDLDGIPVDKKERQGALARARDYMGRWSQAIRGEREDILNDSSAVWAIEKWPAEEFSVESILSSSPRGKWAGEIREELPRFVRIAMEEKTRKLAHLDGSRVLLLVDRYRLAESREWRAALPQDLVAAFHTVARVHGACECEVLSTMEPAWLPPKAGA